MHPTVLYVWLAFLACTALATVVFAFTNRTALTYWTAFVGCGTLAVGALALLLASNDAGQAFGTSDFLLGTVCIVFAGLALKYLRKALMS